MFQPSDNAPSLEVSHKPTQTPGGPSPKWSTPKLPPSTTEEINNSSNNAVSSSTVNDELFAWLLQNKVDDVRIGNYLCLHEVTIDELVTFSYEDLKDLTKDIEKELNTTIQIIDKKRFIQACQSLPRHSHQTSIPHGIYIHTHILCIYS